MMFESRGSMVTAPMEYEPSPSNTGVQEVPLFSVRHTPPEATPTKYRARFLGSTASAEIRPETNAGPTERSFSPEKVSDENGSFGLSSSAFLSPSGLFSSFAAAAGTSFFDSCFFGATVGGLSESPLVPVLFFGLSAWKANELNRATNTKRSEKKDWRYRMTRRQLLKVVFR